VKFSKELPQCRKSLFYFFINQILSALKGLNMIAMGNAHCKKQFRIALKGRDRIVEVILSTS